MSAVPAFAAAALVYGGQLPFVFAAGVLLYLLAIAVHYALIAFEAAQEAERGRLELAVLTRDAELRALRAQIDPHFLYNSLNSISAMTSRDPAGARRMCLMLGDFVFGWAKPVPVSARNLRHPRRDMALVAAAGPAANLAMALAWGVLLKIAIGQGAAEGLWLGVAWMCSVGIGFNLMLMALNLLPIPPLDGGRVLGSLLPPALSAKLDRIEPYGFVIIIALMALQLLGPLMSPLVAAGQTLIVTLLGLQ
jgi:hypothetical protein